MYFYLLMNKDFIIIIIIRDLEVQRFVKPRLKLNFE